MLPHLAAGLSHCPRRQGLVCAGGREAVGGVLGVRLFSAPVAIAPKHACVGLRDQQADRSAEMNASPPSPF